MHHAGPPEEDGKNRVFGVNQSLRRELKSLKVADLRLRLQEGGCPPGTDTAKLTKDKCIKELLAVHMTFITTAS